MLIACQTCHRQYDVGDLRAGRRVRCACGELMTVPDAVPQRVRMLHCSTCGGRLTGEGDPCQFCAAEPDPKDLERGTLCPSCFARIRDRARFCDTCGVEIEVEAVVKSISDHECPRCQAELMLHEDGRDTFYSCSGCQGIWLSKEALNRFVDEARPEGQVRFPEPLPKDIAAHRRKMTEDRVSTASIHCPVCKGVMRRFPFGGYSGVNVDKCHSHGYWFDADELEQIREFVSKGGLEWAKKRRIRRRHLFARQRARIRKREREQGIETAGLLAHIGLGLLGLDDD